MPVRTVTGVIEVSELGFCQPHEHLFVLPGSATERYPALRCDNEAKSLSELNGYRAAGGCSLIDCQPGGAGRDARALARIGAESGVHIVSVTGYHLPIFYEEGHWVFGDSEEALYARFTRELSEGMIDHGTHTGVIAGAVKAAMDIDGPTGRFAVLLRAAARAAADAHVPLILHTERGIGGVEAVKLCETQGLAPTHLLVCHVDRQVGDYSPHEQIARTGAMLEYDTIARYKYHDDEAEQRLILHMLSRGYRDQLLFSLDTTSERLLSYGGKIGLTFLLKAFLPTLAQAGVSETDLRKIMVDNPACVFS